MILLHPQSNPLGGFCSKIWDPPGARGKRTLSEYSIRGIGSRVKIVSNGREIGERALPMALDELHQGAVYFLAGTKYIVKQLLYPDKMRATIEYAPKNYPYYTKALTDEWPTIEEIYEKKQAFGTEIVFCRLHVKKTVYGYANIKAGANMQGTRVNLEQPLYYDFVTKGMVFHAPQPDRCADDSDDPEYLKASGYHAAEHVIIEGSNMVTGGASQDLGGISLGTSGLVFVYDGAVGGSGASRALYDARMQFKSQKHAKSVHASSTSMGIIFISSPSLEAALARPPSLDALRTPAYVLNPRLATSRAVSYPMPLEHPVTSALFTMHQGSTSWFIIL